MLCSHSRALESGIPCLHRCGFESETGLDILVARSLVIVCDRNGVLMTEITRDSRLDM